MKKLASLLLALCLLASVFSFGIAEESKDEMHYGFAVLSFADYWAGELGVPASDLDKSNDKLDKEGYPDAGMFDAVSRPTDHHGVYRAQFMFNVELEGAKVLSKTAKEGKDDEFEYTVDESATNKSLAFAKFDGINEEKKINTKSVEGFLNFEDRQETYNVDDVDYKLTHYNINGIRYVPIAVPDKLLEVAKTKYHFHETCPCCVNPDTNGLKTMLDENNFSARQVKSFEKETAIASDGVSTQYNTKYGSDAEAHISLARADGKELTEEVLFAYLTSFQTARVDYYGDDANFENLVASFGTKHASDTWWKPRLKTHRLDLGINYGYDRFKGAGPGYYKFTLIAKGYPDVVATAHFLPFISDASGNKPEITVNVDGTKLSVAGVEDYTNGATVDLKKGKGKHAEPVVSGVSLENNSITLENALEADTYTLKINFTDYAPEEIVFEVK